MVDIQTAVPIDTKLEQTLIQAKDAPVLANTFEVVTGSTVNGIFLTVEVVATEVSTGKTPNFYLAVYKNPGNNITFPDANAIGSSDSKRFVFHQEMVMINAQADDSGNPRNVFKGVIRLPPRFKRFGPDDRLFAQLFIPSTGVACNACLQCHYKEFR